MKNRESKRKHRLVRLFSAAILLVLAACREDQASEIVGSAVEKNEAKFDPMGVELTDDSLAAGRAVWMDTCADCHLNGLGGAPRIGVGEAWRSRVQKGKETLYQHAINGYFGNVGEMPARGGNDALTDEEVKRAVDFVVYASQ